LLQEEINKKNIAQRDRKKIVESERFTVSISS
jgi:hypothetical protein